ncbi:HAD domain-containing protein [Nannocystis sp. SCPEA4]|uniref:HAD domain-containing protein n=1 Tax=Nannocystis sp. SCPEA4 TaxID=2996787 RepID=UPI002271FFF4|nr:HAD domain-containing protein [Nannocystis sp. SCPEA4]
MPRKVIFLDIDGVMNSLAGKAGQRGLSSWLDPVHVALLNDVVRATGAVVVVSSSWRRSMPLDALRLAFAEAGCVAEVVDVTPDLDPGRRGREIAAWLAAQREPPTRYAILDDTFDMPELPGKLVKTSRVEGLTAREVPRLLALLAD